MKYYKVATDKSTLLEGIGLAYQLDSGGLPFILPNYGYVREWTPLRLLILEGIEGGYADYQPNDMAARMCSQRLRSVLEDHASKADVLQWLDVSIKGTQHTKPRPYYILHFPRAPAVLDKSKTEYVGRGAVRPVLARKVAERHHVFCYRGAGQFRLFVSEKVRRAIQSLRLTGMTFTPLRTDDELA